MIRQAIVVAGGKGSRLGSLARVHGNKALVPVCGEPVLLHTIRWLKEAGVQSIVVTINYISEFKKISALLADDKSVAVIGNLSRQNSAQCLFPIRGLLDPQYFFVYGHAPVPPEHILNMTEVARKGGRKGVVVSLFHNSSQREGSLKLARFDGERVIMDGSGDCFIEPPHILNHELTHLLGQTDSWKRAFQLYQRPIRGVVSDHPSEFHDRKDLARLRDWFALAEKSRND